MSEEYKSFKEFYPFYLSHHKDLNSRRLHFAGTALGLLFLLSFLFTLNFWHLILAVIFGYGLAWIGHSMFEKNKPLSFEYPLYSLLGDLKMFAEVFTGKNKLW